MNKIHSEDNIQAVITEDIIDLSMEDKDADITLKTDAMPVQTSDYRKLKNKPTINGTELYDNYDEIDPTVHQWAKEENKPRYDVNEIDDALDQNNELTFAEIKDVFDLVFNN